MPLDEGGEPPCYEHLLDDDTPAGAVRLGVVASEAPNDAVGALWSLTTESQLDANLVRLGPNGVIDAHRYDDLDVLVVVVSGSAVVNLDGAALLVEADDLVHIPRGTDRSFQAGADGFVYLSIHQNRGPLAIRPHSS